MSAREFAFCAALACLVYANSFSGGFVIDDGSAIRTNQDLRPETPISDLLRHDYWGRPIDSELSVKSYKPLAVLSFRFNYYLHGLQALLSLALALALPTRCLNPTCTATPWSQSWSQPLH